MTGDLGPDSGFDFGSPDDVPDVGPPGSPAPTAHDATPATGTGNDTDTSIIEEIRTLAIALTAFVVALNGIFVAIAKFGTDRQVQVAIEKTDANRDQIAKVSASNDSARADLKEVLVATSKDGAERLDNLAKVSKATHTFVNSDMSIQLEINRDLARKLADRTGDPADRAAADLADRKYREHQAKQADVNAQPGTDSQKRGDDP